MHKLFRHLTPKFGHPKLRDHLGALVMAMKLSPSWEGFMETVNRLLPKHPPIEDKYGQRSIQIQPSGEKRPQLSGPDSD